MLSSISSSTVFQANWITQCVLYHKVIADKSILWNNYYYYDLSDDYEKLDMLVIYRQSIRHSTSLQYM